MISLILIISIIFLVGCNSNNLKHNDCTDYCKDEGYNSGKCFDCVYLENVDLPTECTKNNFLSNDITMDICTETRLKDNTQYGCLCAEDSPPECDSDKECKVICKKEPCIQTYRCIKEKCIYSELDTGERKLDTVIKSVSLETETPILFGGRDQYQSTQGDLWLSTWAENDNLYMSWGDGSGFESEDGTDLGIAEVIGKVPNFTGTNVFIDPSIFLPECAEVDCKVPFYEKMECCLINDDKPSSLLSIGGVLYAQFHSSLGDPTVGYLAYSDNYGKTWVRLRNESPWTAKNVGGDLLEGSNFRCMFFINMGKNYELNEDGYVYAFGIGREWGWNEGVYLTRVLKDHILDYDSYEYFTEILNDGPQWSLVESDAQPLENLEAFEQFSSIYHEGIRRYILLDNQNLYEALNPWGPWILAGRWKERGWAGYQPGIISKGTGDNSFWFTISGNSPDGQDISYKLNLGKIVLELK